MRNCAITHPLHLELDTALIYFYLGSRMLNCFDCYPSSLLYSHRIKLPVHNVQSADGAKQAEEGEYDGRLCSPFHPTKGTVLIFLFVCVSGLIIGLYLISKSEDLIANATNCNTNRITNISDAVAYLGYAICLVAPFYTFCWLLWRIVACHGLTFL